MKKLILILSVLLAAIPAFGKTLNVVTTLQDLAALVKEVGRDRVNVSSLIVGARDPHRLEAKPSYMSRTASADLFVAIGLELEVGYEPPILDGSGNSRVQVGSPGHVYVSEWVPLLEVPKGNVTRAEGDIHPYGNPHLWLDPFNGRIIALKLAEKMGELDKSNAAFFKSNAEDFVKRLDSAMFGSVLVAKFGGLNLWQWDNENKLIPNLKEKGAEDLLAGWCGTMHKFWGTHVVVYHRSWSYFMYRFGIKVGAELEPKPGLDPTPGHTASVIKAVQEEKMKAILQEPFYSSKNAEFVAQRTSASVVVAPGSVGQDPAAKDYISLFDTIVGRVAAALGK